MLGIGSGSFDPESLVILETAFDEAWITLKSNGSSSIRPDELARRICHLAMEGERDPVRLHDRALLGLMPATTSPGAQIKFTRVAASTWRRRRSISSSELSRIRGDIGVRPVQRRNLDRTQTLSR